MSLALPAGPSPLRGVGAPIARHRAAIPGVATKLAAPRPVTRAAGPWAAPVPCPRGGPRGRGGPSPVRCRAEPAPLPLSPQSMVKQAAEAVTAAILTGGKERIQVRAARASRGAPGATPHSRGPPGPVPPGTPPTPPRAAPRARR